MKLKLIPTENNRGSCNGCIYMPKDSGKWSCGKCATTMGCVKPRYDEENDRMREDFFIWVKEITFLNKHISVI